MLASREYHSMEEVRGALASRLSPVPLPSLFDRIEWYEALHRHCLAGTSPRIIQAVEGHAEVWMMLASPAPRQATALANWYSFRWAPLFLGEPDGETRVRLLDAAARQMMHGRAHVDLYPLEAPDELLAALRRTGWFAVARPMGGRHLLRVEGRSFADYWSGRPGRLRALVRRKGRADPFALSIHDMLSDALWADYVAVHESSWKEPEPAGGLALLREIAEREGAAGRLRLGFARRDGRAVAAQLWTVEGGAALIHKLNHDRALDARSPGTLLSHAMFAHAIDVDRVETIDYGTGDNAYKSDWMDVRLPLHRIDAFNPRFASAWLPAARTAISALVG
ncbi:GNAT family N-acetyltransferase [Sphingobium olei]|uniref:GNAT family N-acetyltransferase n=1 Tax=Sphingobium olei TaxID=420955 RepID=A0ABW3NVD4_9SPHN